MRTNKWLVANVVLGGCLFGAFLVGAQTNTEAINPGAPWPATDALGPRLPLPDEVGPLRNDRFVGIFYFLNHGGGRRITSRTDGPYDVSKVLAQDPEAANKPDSPLLGTHPQQPLLGGAALRLLS